MRLGVSGQLSNTWALIQNIFRDKAEVLLQALLLNQHAECYQRQQTSFHHTTSECINPCGATPDENVIVSGRSRHDTGATLILLNLTPAWSIPPYRLEKYAYTSFRRPNEPSNLVVK